MTHPAPAPFTYAKGKGFYFVDATGTHWRVVDAAHVNGRPVVLTLGSSRAAYRVFSPHDAPVRVYFFRPRELRGTRPSHLVRQLQASGELGTVDPVLLHADD